MFKNNFFVGLLLILLCNFSFQTEIHEVSNISDAINVYKNVDMPQKSQTPLTMKLIKQARLNNESVSDYSSCISGESYYLSGVGVWAYTEKLTYGVNTDAQCESICYATAGQSIGWTRLQSANMCYCFNQPFGINNSPVSASLSSNWNSGFFRNMIVTTCGNYVVSGQHIMFSSYFSPGYTSSPADCTTKCYDYSYTVWTRASDSGTCYCGLNNFESTVLEYDPNWYSGFSFI